MKHLHAYILRIWEKKFYEILLECDFSELFE